MNDASLLQDRSGDIAAPERARDYRHPVLRHDRGHPQSGEVGRGDVQLIAQQADPKPCWPEAAIRTALKEWLAGLGLLPQ